MKNKYLFSVLLVVSISLALGQVMAADAPLGAQMQINAQIGSGTNASANVGANYNGENSDVEYNGNLAMHDGNQNQERAREMSLEHVENHYELRFGNYSINCANCNLTQARVMTMNQSLNGSVNGSMGENGSGQFIRATLSNGKNADIKIMPDKASEVALNRLRLRVCNETTNCSIELKEVGEGNQTRLAYNVDANATAKVFGIFKAKANVATQVDAETGDVISTKRPWWSFMASWKN